MKILLIGKTGQVGWELRRALAPLGAVIAPDRHGLDLAAADSIRAAIREAKPDVIVNAAAYTAVDKAESEADLAMRVNGAAPGIMAEEAKRIGALLVHYSTDYVFDGTKDGAYVEDDRPNPLNSYGRSKLAGEEAIRAAGCPHLVFRTSWVYAARGSNFVLTMLRLARERAELRIVDDQVGAPTWARSIAEGTAQALSHKDVRERSGLYHLTASGAVTWFGFAKAIFDEASVRLPGFKAPALVPVPASQYPLPAPRPANSRLSTARFSSAFGITPPGWEDMLRKCLADMS
jgi:dTDP-4-dehydrorhamnose reductase